MEKVVKSPNAQLVGPAKAEACYEIDRGEFPLYLIREAIPPLPGTPPVAGSLAGLPPSSMSLGAGQVFSLDQLNAAKEEARREVRDQYYQAQARNREEVAALARDRDALNQQLTTARQELATAQATKGKKGEDDAAVLQLTALVQGIQSQMNANMEAQRRVEDERRITEYRAQRLRESPEIDPRLVRGRTESEIEESIQAARAYAERLAQVQRAAQPAPGMPNSVINPAYVEWMRQQQLLAQAQQTGWAPPVFPQDPAFAVGPGGQPINHPQNMIFHPNQNATFNGMQAPPRPAYAPSQLAYGMPGQPAPGTIPMPQPMPMPQAPGWPQGPIQPQFPGYQQPMGPWGVPQGASPWAGGPLPQERVFTDREIMGMPMDKYLQHRQELLAAANAQPFVTAPGR